MWFTCLYDLYDLYELLKYEWWINNNNLCHLFNVVLMIETSR